MKCIQRSGSVLTQTIHRQMSQPRHQNIAITKTTSHCWHQRPARHSFTSNINCRRSSGLNGILSSGVVYAYFTGNVESYVVKDHYLFNRMFKFPVCMKAVNFSNEDVLGDKILLRMVCQQTSFRLTLVRSMFMLHSSTCFISFITFCLYIWKLFVT